MRLRLRSLGEFLSADYAKLFFSPDAFKFRRSGFGENGYCVGRLISPLWSTAEEINLSIALDLQYEKIGPGTESLRLIF